MTLPISASAQDERLDASWQDDNRHGVSVDFRVNSTVIDPKYRNNGTVLERIDSLFNAIAADTLVDIVSIEFCGSASPEGNSVVNRRLSNARMKAIEKMVKSHHDDIPQDIIVYNDHYIAWDHLIELVEADETLPLRNEVLQILRTSYPDAKDWHGVVIDGRIPELRKLQGGYIWNLMNQRYFVQMRNAWFIMVTTRTVVPEPEPVVEPEPVAEPEPVVEAVEETAVVEEVAPAPVEEVAPAPAQKKRVPVMSFKTNALEVAALIANIGMEFRFSPRWSLDVIGHYSPYDYFQFDRKSRVFAIQPELRFWWGESLVKGHFIGLHVPVGGFNIQLNDNYRYQDPNRAAWGVGLSYGYALPFGKSNWGVEFTIGAGYMNIVYDVYEGVLNGKLLRTESKNYFGITRLGIDISCRINKTKKDKKTKTIGE